MPLEPPSKAASNAMGVIGGVCGQAFEGAFWCLKSSESVCVAKSKVLIIPLHHTTRRRAFFDCAETPLGAMLFSGFGGEFIAAFNAATKLRFLLTVFVAIIRAGRASEGILHAKRERTTCLEKYHSCLRSCYPSPSESNAIMLTGF